MKRLTQRERQRLALQVYDFAICRFETFREDNVDADLAYLMGAILESEGTCFVSWTDAEEAGPLKAAMKEHFPNSHAVWQFAKLH